MCLFIRLFLTENKPIASSGAVKVTTASCEPNLQTASGNLLFTPGREQVSNAGFVSARNQPSWAEIFTPQRATSAQDFEAQVARSQAFHEPLRTPVNQPSLQGDICTPQRITGVQNTSLAQAQSETLATPLRHVAIPPESFSSDHPPNWSEIFTPQRATRQPEAMMTNLTSNPLSTPVQQSLPTNQRSGAIKDLGSRLRCSKVEITSFKPNTDTSCFSRDELQEPKQMSDIQDEPLLTPLQVSDYNFRKTVLKFEFFNIFVEELNRIIKKCVALKRDKRCHISRESSFLSIKRHGLFVYLPILNKVSLLLKPNPKLFSSGRTFR